MLVGQTKYMTQSHGNDIICISKLIDRRHTTIDA